MTDSNMLNYGPLLNFFKKVLPVRIFRKKHAKEKMEAYDLKILNVISSCASAGIADTLWNYLGYIHVDPDDRKYIKMKNEFFYSRLIVTFAMKSYIALLKRREEVVLDKPKLDVKGVNFFKSTASKKTSNFIYDELLMKRLLATEDGNISLRDTYKAIQDFQKGIKSEVQNGELGFMRQSVKVKSPDAYSKPMSIGQYKSVFVWNYLAKDSDQIALPAIVTSVKVKLRDKKDVSALAPWPHIYSKMMELFETNPDIGDTYVMKDGKERKVKGKGIKSIALPDSYEKVPDWLLAIIDTETIVNDNTSLMTQLLLPLGYVQGGVSHNGSTLRYFQNIVRL